MPKLPRTPANTQAMSGSEAAESRKPKLKSTPDTKNVRVCDVGNARGCRLDENQTPTVSAVSTTPTHRLDIAPVIFQFSTEALEMIEAHAALSRVQAVR